MSKIKSSNLGYPRIGEQREWKRALESFWNGEIKESELLEQTKEIRLNNVKKQIDAEIDLIPVGDFSLYDHVLDTASDFGLIPDRYEYEGGRVDLNTYFELARGSKAAIASEMTKWFNTNYHYIVPELDRKPTYLGNKALTYFNEAKEAFNIKAKPVILGPISFVSLAKGYETSAFKEKVTELLPLYTRQLKELSEAGAEWVQIDEPIFTTNLDKDILELTHEVYAKFKQSLPELKLIFQTYFEKIQNYQAVSKLLVDGIGLDFVHGKSLEAIQTHGFPQDKVLFAGIIDGRNVWRADLTEKLALIDAITHLVKEENLVIQPSASLLHVPVTTKTEKRVEPVIKNGLSFADEKLKELTALKNRDKKSASESRKALDALNKAYRSSEGIASELAQLTETDAERKTVSSKRLELQKKAFNLPLLPTTTIGSLPQTPEVRQTRAKWRRDELSDQAYESFIKSKISEWIEIQESLDLDVLVHGEFERNDMVEYFGEKLGGFLVTDYGWVQSYGSRCVKPPLIFGDVEWTGPITVAESVYAQSLTSRPVKGMLTGPVTILNWSFAHNDLAASEIMNQIALALQKEIRALEEAGIKIIQVDEPALREGLPLVESDWQAYLNEAAYAFRLATAKVEDTTQIHTHMCYSNFEDIFSAIDDLDADVISIETSRSHGELIETFEENTYKKEIGLGVYDIHSPRIPRLDEVKENIHRALKTISPEQFWVNPDCGLKTRKEDETIDALKVMIKAAKETRNELV